MWGKRETKFMSLLLKEESISPLLYYCTRAKRIWDLIESVILGGDNSIHDIVIFGYDWDNHCMKSEFLCSLWQHKESFMPFMANCKWGFYVFVP